MHPWLFLEFKPSLLTWHDWSSLNHIITRSWLDWRSGKFSHLSNNFGFGSKGEIRRTVGTSRLHPVGMHTSQRLPILTEIAALAYAGLRNNPCQEAFKTISLAVESLVTLWNQVFEASRRTCNGFSNSFGYSLHGLPHDRNQYRRSGQWDGW